MDAQPGEGAGGGALDRADGTAERCGGLQLRELVVVAQDDDGALPGGERLQSAQDRVAVVHRLDLVGVGGEVGDAGGGALPPRLAPPPVGVGRHQDPSDIRVRAGAHPAPGDLGLGQGGLHEVLR